jgi:hypothetical protein
MDTACSPKRWCLPTSSHGLTTQKTNIYNITTVITLGLVFPNAWIYGVRCKLCLYYTDMNQNFIRIRIVNVDL